MKTLYTLLFLTLSFFISDLVLAQNQKDPVSSQNFEQQEQTDQGKFIPCLALVTPEQKEYELSRDRNAYNQLIKRLMSSGSRAATDFKIQFHIVTRDDGSGGVDPAEIRAEFTTYVNPYFALIDVSFVECAPPNYINSTAFFDITSFGEGDNLSSANNVADVINMYFVNSAKDGSFSACGWATFPASSEDYILIANGCHDNQSTIVHELGHYFDLYHTHETDFGVESVTRDPNDACYDCDVDGDLLCDTEADPVLTNNVDPGCVYDGTPATGPCGPDAYNPDPTNIMSYSLKACRTVFTAGQQGRMAAAVAISRSYLETGPCCPKPTAVCNDITVNLNAAGNVSITPADVDNGSTWDCGFGSWSVSPNSFDCSDVGPNTVTLTVMDAVGWESTCEATVTIADVTDPVITTPASDEDVECDGEGNVADYNAWLSTNGGGAAASDACGGSWSHNATGLSNGCGATGSETVTFTYTDPSGNSASTSATFTIEDNTDPSVTCPDDIHLPECVETASWVVVANDQCGDVTVVSNPPSGSVFPKGTTTTVTVTVTDECGNETSCSFEVERDPDLVVDIDPVPTSPLRTCAVGTNANIVLGYGGGPTCRTLTAVGSGGHAPYTYSWEAPAAVPGASFTNSNTASPTFCADFQTEHCVTYTFRVTVTDFHGCEETNEVEVSVVNVGVFGDGSPCAKPNNAKVVLCHIPAVHPENQQTLCLSPNAVPAHYDGNPNGHNDDCLGDCDAVCVSETPEGAAAKYMGDAAFEGSKQESSLYSMSVTPNPFRQSTTIEMVTRTDTDVRLAVFDVSGRLVAELFEGTLSRGVPHYVEFQSNGLQAGIYIAKLIGINGDTQSSTMVLVR